MLQHLLVLVFIELENIAQSILHMTPAIMSLPDEMKCAGV